MSQSDALSFDAVALSLGERRILDRVSFAIPQGAFVGVLGPNGAGKTTLMRAVLGILPISGGAIRVLGRSPARGGAGIGYVPQFRRGAMQLRLTGFDLVVGAVAGTRWGWPFASRADRLAA
ncbi:MAG: ATP-binding cassette domain-containing protein, partial [Beijerinckiaceae bacterium]|nr:ATP-binding cassette domain-containing protein [Beijerinckiaceae bacterium]